MRLTDSEIESIKTAFASTFEGGKIYLFGSRIDDQARGGDIDLYIEPNSHDQLARKKIEFLVELKNMIGDQKIDVVIDRDENRLIDKIAKEKGVLLWSN